MSYLGYILITNLVIIELKMKKIFLPIAFSALILGCSNPKDEVLPPNMTEADMTVLAENVKSLSEEDKLLLTQYIIRSEMSKAFGGDGASTGTTVGEAIDNQKQWNIKQEAEQQAKAERAAKLKAEKDAKTAEFEKAVAVTVFDKDFVEVDWQSFINLDVDIKNNSSKEIAGLKGTINFFDKFGDLIRPFRFGDDTLDIPAGESYKGTLSWDYNQFMDEDSKFVNTSLESMKYNFEPEQILFKDGTKLDMPVSN